MTPQRIVGDCYRIPLGIVNAFVIACPGELTLIDTGLPGEADRIEAALAKLGYSLGDLRNILVTHCHRDHAGSLAELQRRAPQARTFMHQDDAWLVEQGRTIREDRPLRPAPGPLNFLLFHLLLRWGSTEIEPAKVDCRLRGHERLNIAGGITVLHAPGHTRGQACFLWEHEGGVLFAADTACCVFGLTYSVAYEDFELGKRVLANLCRMEFQYACFGHGKTIVRNPRRDFSARFARVRHKRLVPASELATST
ncbi:MBL fold metallo-hydrolase [Candidatus Laterigemmans baculatus]|uniref:MBL fold metallo-hydrolase n=1 Tax=Candidatus Laterigemmans baculatus TaxID=2770505 RepID=UPI0013DD389E|nr:MBL fold metallo-hydrolase [Candidatus Laterigemmans baculatus]